MAPEAQPAVGIPGGHHVDAGIPGLEQHEWHSMCVAPPCSLSQGQLCS